MEFDLVMVSAAISADLFVIGRGGRPRLLDRGPSDAGAIATFTTSFHGHYRVEVVDRLDCRVGIEHVAGDAAFDWTMAELDRRRPRPAAAPGTPMASPAPDDLDYRCEVVEVDPEPVRALLATLAVLDWSEPTPDGSGGRDGVVLSGELVTADGARTWVTWSPDPTVEPAKDSFFRSLASFAAERASRDLRRDLELALL